jgi:hypothetical protein
VSFTVYFWVIVNFVIKFRCKCFTGLKGNNCDEVDDPCSTNPCHNNAKCVPKLLRDPSNFTMHDNDDIFKEYTCR